MYLNPLRDFVRKILFGRFQRSWRGRGLSRGRRLPLKSRPSFAVAAELCEARTLLSGPQLIQVVPNTGAAISLAGSTVENQAPNQLTFTFSPGVAIDPTSVTPTSGAISVFRSGGTGVFGPNSIPVAIGSLSVNSQDPNLVTLRFADSLPDDTYQIQVTGKLKDTNGNIFNGGTTETVNFTVDFGAQVVSVVPQPVLRTELLSVTPAAGSLSSSLTLLDPTKISNGDTFTIDAGNGPVTFKFVGMGGVPTPGEVTVGFLPGEPAGPLAGAMLTAIQNSSLAGSLTASLNGTTINLVGKTSAPVVSFTTVQSGALSATAGGGGGASITSGDTFTITAGGAPVTFQFQNASGPSVLQPGNIGITYNASDSPATIAADIAAAINGTAGQAALQGAVSAIASGSSVQLNGRAFSPIVSLGSANTSQLTVADGALTQALDTIDVYFNKDPLNATLAQDPAFYQVLNTADGSILLPSSVVYNAAGNTAVLKFASNLPAGTFHLQIGAPKLNNNSIAGAVDAGTIFSTLDLRALAGTTEWDIGSNTVTGTGTFFTTLQPGAVLLGPDGNFYKVAGVASDTSLTLSATYFGATNTAFTTSTPLLTGKLQGLAGTTNWATGSDTVTGVGTTFSALQPGELLLGPDGNLYRVAGITNDTTLTLATNFGGSTQSSSSTEFLPISGFTTVGFIGTDAAGLSTDIKSVNLYQFQVATAGTITVTASQLAPGLGANVFLRLFDANGTELANSSTNTLTVANVQANATYYLGVSGAGNTGYDPNNASAPSTGTAIGSYKVSIIVTNPAVEGADTTSFATATNLGNLGSAGFTISGQIAPLGNLAYPALPGGPGTPGNRNLDSQGVNGESNSGTNSGSSVPGRIPVFYYNFQDVYGTDPQGNILHNAITENQKQDAREIFAMYGQYLGVEFVETANSGLTVVTGDVRAVDPGISPTSVGGISGGGEVIMNANPIGGDYGTSPYGGSWFGIAFHEIGHALGLSHSFDAPSVMGDGVGGAGGETGQPAPGSIGAVEPVYPGDINLVPAMNINPPDSTDVNIYKFSLTQSGTFSAETIAQRLTDVNGNPDPSLLDSVITLYSEASIQASQTTDFNTGNLVNVAFTANAPGIAGNGIAISIAKADLGAGAGPMVSVNGNSISVVLNTHLGTHTTAQQLVSAINSDLLASELVTATVSSGDGSADIAAPIINYSPLVLSGGTGSRQIVARNDDYFGRDSFVNLHLAAGTYYVAVSSTGNTSFDPSIADSGFGGRTDGAYQLKMSFTADAPLSALLNDKAGVALDGDGGNATGGTFNFWFQANTGDITQPGGNTIFVDKLNANDLNQDGSLAHPYSNISSAILSAQEGMIVRIEGNGGTDANPTTLADDNPYLIGYDSLGNPEQDGSTFVIPKGVTVMMDAGVVIKLHSAIIDVGHTVPNVDRSGSALQVLGTPNNQVTFTSLFNDQIGGRSDPNNFSGATPGDWGGIVFGQTSDVQQRDWLGNGIFVNSVNQANFTFGGGQVVDDSVLETFDPIFVQNVDPTAQFFARPAIWFNSISSSAEAAMSADPNSFANTEDRAGLDVYGNEVTGNTVNGMFIRIRTNAGEPIDVLGLPARLKHTDIVYVLAENLNIVGNAGGPYEPDPSDPTHAGWQARVAGSLVIDPGVILKISGAHIEAQVGDSQVIAEGTASNPVILTSYADDSYGAGGTFDTNADGAATTANKGDWGGIFFNSGSRGSIDHAVVQYGGGVTPIAGGFDSFNTIEIQQATVRIANSLFQNNASGAASSDRNGLLGNDGATIFVRGAQPVIVDNTFINNDGFIVSVNANALNADIVPDWGDSTGTLNAFTQFGDNHGPLVALNTETGNTFNGMEVRAEEVTTQTIWDDTDIVHIVTGQIDDIINQHTFGGILLESSTNASLVVKFDGANSGFLINGIPLDIADRIGGTLQIIGTPNHPVVLTSIHDDTVGAGFAPNGQPQNDTDNDGGAIAPQPGDWAGINLGQYSNDRNVATVIEQTSPHTLPGSAQFLGSLAPDLSTDTQSNPQGGNDYQPLGFDVHGILGQPSEVDTYSFTAKAGTEVWFDLGLTSPALSSVLELVDANGKVLASSHVDASGTNQLGAAPGVAVLTMMKDPLLGGDFYTSNPRDAGMRVFLPGAAGSSNTYFIRVRSQDALTQGEYQLQVRLRQQWESPGSTIQYSDISYAANGVTLQGLPNHSPLSGTTSSLGSNTSFGTAQDLGNLTTTDTNTLSVAGNIASPTSVEWYKFELNYNLIESIGGVNGAAKTFSTIFDIDYADGLARPDTTLSVFDSTGKLILVSRDSNVVSDHPGPNQGNGFANLSAGSIGQLDPFIGPQQMPAGTPTAGTDQTYYVAISSNETLPTALSASFQLQAGSGSSGDQLVRLEPVDSVQRIVEDHIGFTGYTSGDVQQSNPVNPTTGAILPIDTSSNVATNVTPYTLSDVVGYGVEGGHVFTIDPSSGGNEYDLGSIQPNPGLGLSLKMRSDGTLYGYMGLLNSANNAGELITINTGVDPTTPLGTVTVIGTDGIPDLPTSGKPNGNQLTTDQIDSFVWIPTGFSGGKPTYDLYYAVHDGAGIYNSGTGASRLYRANPASGSAAVVQGQPWGAIGEIASGNQVFATPGANDPSIGFTTGMEVVGGTVYGVSSTGKLYTIDLGSGTATVIKSFSNVSFTGLTLGPQNLNGGSMANLLFATTQSGNIMAFDTAGNVQSLFAFGTSGFTSAQSIALSPLDFNLWHPTTQGATLPGHGVNQAFDNSRNTIFLNAVGSLSDSRNSSETQGGASYYFGMENWVQNITPSTQSYITYGPDAQYGVLSADYQRALTSNANIQNNFNLPGGAHGSLVTNSFSLSGYSAGDAPTLYFDYMLQGDQPGSTSRTNSGGMTDSARVYVTTDGGTTWTEVATNNLFLSTNTNPAELPPYLTPDVKSNLTNPFGNQQVQPLYGTDNWRQARIDLSEFAGSGNVQLRFDFSSSGTTVAEGGFGVGTQGLQGDQFGVGPNNSATAKSNNFFGFAIDDILVGFANRGEMVTGAASGETSFYTLPQNPDPTAPKQSLIGPYQLEIRPAQQYGTLISTISPDIVLPTTGFDDNQRMTSGITLTAPAGSVLTDGQTFTISDGSTTLTFEFDSNGILNTPGAQGISFGSSDPDYKIAQEIRDAVNAANAAGKTKVTAEIVDGTITGSNSDNPNLDLFNAIAVTPLSSGTDLTATLNGSSIPESGGTISGTVTRQGDLSKSVTVNLSVIDAVTGLIASDLAITPSVTIGAGATSASFTVTTSNSTNVFGTQTIMVRPTATGYNSISAPLDVQPNATAALTLALNQSSLVEGTIGSATVSRNTSTGSALVVNLASLNSSRVVLPPSVTIPAGQSSVTFNFITIDDGVANDGNHAATLIASANGFVPSSQTVTLTDSGVQSFLPSPGTNVDLSKATGNQSEGAIAIDKTNPNNLFAVSNIETGNGLMASYSTNGGATWTTRIMADGSAGGDGLPAACCDPSVSSDGFGNLFMTYLNAAATEVEVLVSSDFGQTFTLLKSYSSASVDQPTITASKFGATGSVWVTFRDFGTGNLVAAGAQVTGLGAANVGAFGAEQNIPGTTSDGSFGDISIGPTGAVMVAYENPTSTSGPAGLYVSTDATGLGGTFGPSLLVTNTNVGGFDYIPGQPNRSVDSEVGLAWDHTSGRVYMVYTDAPTLGSNNLEILVRHSDDNGQTWSAPVSVEDVPVSTDSAFLPRIAVDNAAGSTQGDVAVSWYDTRNDPGLANAAFFTAVSTNDGLSFGKNVQVSAGVSNANDANNGIDFGDYTGLDFNAGAYYPMWADNSGAIPGNPAPPLTTLDEATAKVTITNPVALPTAVVTINPSSVTANGSATGNLTLFAPTGGFQAVSQATTFFLVSSDPNVVQVPPAMTLFPGQFSNNFSVTVVNNGLSLQHEVDLVTAASVGYESVSGSVDVSSTIAPALTVNIPTQVSEGSVVTGTVTRNTPADSDMTVTLISSDPDEASVPQTVVIPAGQFSASFTIGGVQDFQNDGSRVADIIAAAPGLNHGDQAITVLNAPVQFATSYAYHGDLNTPREQGHISISNNTITNSQGYGIVIESARDPGSNDPHPGSVINLPTLDTTRQVPGPNITNNIVAGFGTGGILFSGDADPAGQPLAAVPFGRIVNNTIFGGQTATGIGINVQNNAAPSILNNIISNTATSIKIDGSSALTVVGTEVFKGNTSDPNLGSVRIQLQPTDPLFTDTTQINQTNLNGAGFYLVEFSKAIDSSLNSLQDRAQETAVLSAIGLPPSPIIAPPTDRFGQLRVDDPNVPNATGLGQNIFVDRGALERASFVGPSAKLIEPLDNGPDDSNPAIATVFITQTTPLTQFEIQFSDPGIGVDDSTAGNPASYVVTQDGKTLVNGVDYSFVYNANTHTAIFNSTSVFSLRSTYTITIPKGAVTDLAGNLLQANQPNGSEVFTIIGNAPPNLTAIATLQGLKNIPLNITYAQLLAASDLSVVTGHTPEFMIESVSAGSLSITDTNNVTTTVTTGTIFGPGESLTWQPPLGVAGVTPAFTVIGYDPQNASIAPALAQSSPPVQVNVNLVNVAPTLTSIATLTGALEDTPFSISYASFLAASNAADANNDPISFRITSVQPNALFTITHNANTTNVVAGTTIFGAGDTLTWQGPLNANSQINGGPLNAFSVVASDGALESSPPVQVNIDVTPEPDKPILTQVNTLGLAGLNSPFRIDYATLVANSDAQNVDGHPIQFQVTSVAAGSLLVIRPGGSIVNATTAVPGTIVSTGDQLIWTPPSNVSGAAVPAFSIVGYDAFNAANFPAFATSSPPVTVTVHVLTTASPTLTKINTLTEPRFVPDSITYSTLLAFSNAKIGTTGDTLGFLVNSVTSGTLSITHNGVTSSVVAGTTVLLPGDTLIWTSAAGATGTTAAFQVSAIDTNNNLTSLDPVQVNVNLVNVAPTLSSIVPLQIADQQTPFSINYVDFLAASNAKDGNNDPITFVIQTVQANGTLQITHNGSTTTAGAGTNFGAGDTLIWTPGTGIFGSAVQAFTVKAADPYGGLSTPAVQVYVKVRQWGTAFSLTGAWTVAGGLARISQSGASLTLVNNLGQGSSGSYIGFNKISAPSYGLTGTIDLSNADQGRIVWSNGTIWLRISLGGQYVVNGTGLGTILQNGVSLSVTPPGGTASSAVINSPTQLTDPSLGGKATFGDGMIMFANGQVWRKLDLASSYTSSTGGSAQITQNSAGALTFVNGVGQASAGNWLTATTLTAFGMVGTVQNGQILWQNGSVWTENLVVAGSSNGTGTTSIGIDTSSPSNPVVLIDINGQNSTAHITGPNTIVVLTGPMAGLTGTRRNGNILWSNGTFWNNFDFNALNALFSTMITSYPFPS